jgi:hypothetical protein
MPARVLQDLADFQRAEAYNKEWNGLKPTVINRLGLLMDLEKRTGKLSLFDKIIR